jgi:hypothetical protein
LRFNNLYTPKHTQMGNTVKNTIIKPFDTIFLIVFGFILTEHTKNLVQLYMSGKTGGILLLGIALFLLLFHSIAETVLDYSNSEEVIKSERVVPNLLRHLVWLLQFFPVFYIVNVLVSDRVEEAIRVREISLSLSVIYFLYFVINLIKLAGAEKQEQSDICVHLVFYLAIAGFYVFCYKYLLYWLTPSANWLAFFLVVNLILYILHWKGYYKQLLFKKTG